jgi:hypothetical protein
MTVPCPDRANFSKNKTLFPIFGLDGAPAWCIVQSMTCPTCRRRVDANQCDVLVQLPSFASEAYPVEDKFAFPSTQSHLSRMATETFDSIMLTYGNGELCSKLLYNSINRAYISRLKVYYSRLEMEESETCNKHVYPEKDGGYIKAFPPLGETIRDMYDAAYSTAKNKWGISDHDRFTREIQSVKCTDVMTQDHTFSITKNYAKKVGAKAAWDVGTDTGEIASVVLVSSTSTALCSCCGSNGKKRRLQTQSDVQ